MLGHFELNSSAGVGLYLEAGKVVIVVLGPAVQHSTLHTQQQPDVEIRQPDTQADTIR